MRRSLSQLLDAIDPRRTFDDLARRASRAMNTMPPLPARMTDWQRFLDFLLWFYLNMEAAVLGLRTPMRSTSKYADMARCNEVLTRLYGQNGRHVAFQMAETCVDGGLRKVLTDITEYLVNTHAEGVIYTEVSDYWHSLSIDEKFAAMNEYFRRFRDMLPPALVRGELVEPICFDKVLREHPHLIRRIRQAGRMG